ncbi:HD-GYP domain-containing protein [Methylomonas albis]|uniref:HD domain-containing protein n=1 Tax=Methylomonas albis TaxID=1854563 RepID=A0ABR9CXK0_9GAMM|nr:HD domain-containing phosphohydrolase [Methylomonas albis]MBD9355450.1 HD domain-containing protein [Methylomonas albis]
MYLPRLDSMLFNDNQDRMLPNRSDELLKTQDDILESLGIAADFKDLDSRAHMLRVGQYAAHLAKSIGFDSQMVEVLLIAAPLHDVGKIGVPDKVLLKPGKLDESEWEMMKQHTTHGYNMLKGSNNSLLKTAEIIALSHHERWDGGGYPLGLKNTEIHLYGRITAIADVYDALTMERPYKKAWTHEQAAALIADSRATQFDPELVDVFQTIQGDFLSISKSAF